MARQARTGPNYQRRVRGATCGDALKGTPATSRSKMAHEMAAATTRLSFAREANVPGCPVSKRTEVTDTLVLDFSH